MQHEHESLRCAGLLHFPIVLKELLRNDDDFDSWEDPWANTAQQRQQEPAEEFELHDDHELLNATRNTGFEREAKYEDGNTIGAHLLIA